MGMRILRIISIQILFASVCSVGLILSGCKKDAPEPITPSESLEAPTADFETDQTGLSIAFSYTGERGETFVWDFGDGATSTEASPTHVYDAYGLYSVELTVSNTGGTAKTSSDVAVEGDALVSIPELGFSNVNGVFYAINHQRVWSVYGEPALVKTGAAKAWCSGTIGYTDVGAVTFKQGDYTASLNRGADNAYTWLESPDEQTGFKKGVGPIWSIAGGGQHGSINGLSNVWPFPATKEVIAEMTSAKLRGKLTQDSSFVQGFEFSVNQDLTSPNEVLADTVQTITSYNMFESEITGLDPHQTYYYRAFASDTLPNGSPGAREYGEIKAFQTFSDQINMAYQANEVYLGSAVMQSGSLAVLILFAREYE